MNSVIPTEFLALLLPFSPCFTAPSFQNFLTLCCGWCLCSGRHTISRVIQAGVGRGRRKHHSSLYRFFSRAVWESEALSEMLIRMVLSLIPDPTVYLIADDTLCRKSGPHLWGAGMFHDPLTSTYGRGGKRKLFFTYAQDWVIASFWVPLPWNPCKGWAVPVVFRLYRSKKRCPPGEYRKRTELAREVVEYVAARMNSEKRLVILGDSEYACQTLIRNLPPEVEFIGPMNMNAAFYQVAPGTRSRGRPRLKGARLPTPRELAQNKRVKWQHRTLRIYGRKVRVMVKTQEGLWYRVAGTRPVRMIVTRDPKGRIEDRAYFGTDPRWDIQDIATGFSRRWTQEVMHRQVKQSLGLEDPQNGWWRRGRGTRVPKKVAGPQPHSHRGKRAVMHTAPLALISYAVVVIWYLKHGRPQVDVQRARDRAPWYRHKKEPSFQDALTAVRREFTRARISASPTLRAVSSKILQAFPGGLAA